MPAFDYQALDPKGRTRKGVLESDSARSARVALRGQGLTPLSVEQVKDERGLRRSLSKLSADELALFTRQLATLVGAGLAIDQALQAIGQQAEQARVRKIVAAVRARVVEGNSLAEGMALFPRAFSDLYRATVAAGEEAGHLPAVLERLADYTESRQALAQKIQLALFYPAILTLVAVGIVMGLMTYVVPQVVDVFIGLDQQLPKLTVALITISDFLRDYWLWLFAAISVLVVLWLWWWCRPGFRYQVYRLWLRLPLLSRLVRGVDAARFARTMSILVGAGVPALKSMQITQSVMAAPPIAAAVAQAANSVREGASVATALGKTQALPPMLIQLVSAGEQSGALDKMFARAAEQQERELSMRISALLGVFEPLLILTMGSVVLVIVLAILVPIFDLNQMVQ